MNRPVIRFGALWALQLVGTLALLAVSYWWLTWPDEKTWQVAASLSVGLIVLVLSLWMEWVVFAAFDHRGTFLRPLFVLAFAIPVAAFAVIELLVAAFGENAERIAVRVAQVLHLPPRASIAAFDWATWTVFWVLIPAVLLPLISLAARDGFAAFRRTRLRAALAVLRRPQYWGGLLVALLVGVWVPFRLIGWIPKRSSLRAEMWSAGLRLSAAYMLAATAIVFLAWLTARMLPAEKVAVESEPRPLVPA